METESKKLDKIKLIGLDLGRKTTNENGQSSTDGGNLWQRFEKGGFAEKIPNKAGDEIYAVYYNYDGDHTQPFQYFIGCRVDEIETVPEEMDSLTIPDGSYNKLTAKGKMPDCIMNKWREIWSSNLNRGYSFDFEVYDERSHDWSNAEIDLYLS